MELGRLGVWWSGSWHVSGEPERNVVGELESVGYGAVWSSAGFGPDLPARFEELLAASSSMVVATGVVNIWKLAPEDLATAGADLDARYGARILAGLGVSHAPLVEEYARPYSHMVRYLDALDAGAAAGVSSPVPAKDRRVLAALGPRMLELAATRAAGAHPYFVPVEHTARARAVLGNGPLLAPEVTVVLETDPGRARQVARTFTTRYLALPNYAENLRSLGFDDDDLAGGGSDRLVDAVVAWGDLGAVAGRVHEHHQAGADHVCLQLVAPMDSFPLAAYRELAGALSESRP